MNIFQCGFFFICLNKKDVAISKINCAIALTFIYINISEKNKNILIMNNEKI